MIFAPKLCGLSLLAAVACLLGCSTASASSIDETVDLLIKPTDDLLGREAVLDLVKSLDSEVAQLEESDDEGLRRVVNSIEKRIGHRPKALAKLLEVSESNCDDYNHMELLANLPDKLKFSLRAGMKEAAWKQQKLCAETFEQRLREKLANLDPSVKSLAQKLAKEFGQGALSRAGEPEDPHAKPFEYTLEHTLGGSVNLLARHFSKLASQDSLPAARDKVFQACETINEQFQGFMWFFTEAKSKPKLAELNAEERAFLSVLKICPFMPYENFDQDAENLLQVLHDPRASNLWAPGGVDTSLELMKDVCKNVEHFSVAKHDLYSQSGPSQTDVERAVQEYVSQSYASVPKSRLAASNSENRRDEFTRKQLLRVEDHCRSLIEHFEPYIYIIDTLKVRPEANGGQLAGKIKEVFVYTKLCSTLLSSPERALTGDQMVRLAAGGASEGARKVSSRLKAIFSKGPFRKSKS